MSDFKMKRRPDLPGGGAEMTLAEHIASKAPHPNYNPTVGNVSTGGLDTTTIINQILGMVYTKDDLLKAGVLDGLYISPDTASRNYAPKIHTHNEYLTKEEYENSSRDESVIVDSNSDGLKTPPIEHEKYANDFYGEPDTSLPMDQGVVYLDHIIENGSYILDSSMAEQLYDTNGNEREYMTIVIQGGPTESSAPIELSLGTITVKVCDPIKTKTDNSQEIISVYRAIQLLVLDNGQMYVRYGHANVPSDDTFTNATWTTVVDYQTVGEEPNIKYIGKSVTESATVESATDGGITREKYTQYTYEMDEYGNATTPLPTTKEDADSYTGWDESTSTSFTTDTVQSYKWDAWQAIVVNGGSHIDLTKNVDGTWLTKDNGGLIDGEDASYTVQNTGWVLIISMVKYVLLCQFGSGDQFPLHGSSGDGAEFCGHFYFYVNAGTTIKFHAKNDNRPDAHWSSYKDKDWDATDGICIKEYGP